MRDFLYSGMENTGTTIFSNSLVVDSIAFNDLNYVNVPVVLKYYLFQGLNVQAGPQFGFILDDDIYVDTFGTNSIEANAEKSDVSGVVGAGYDFPFGIRIDARYNFGLTEVSKTENFEGKNSVFSIALGYSFL